MTDLASIIEEMDPAERNGAVIVLDYMTRPLTTPEITARIRASGVSLARARRIAESVAGWHIVALVGPGVAGD